jgi:hypothetical protein
MKKIIFTLIFSLITSIAYAGAVIGSGQSASAGCTQTTVGTQDGTTVNVGSSTRTCYAIQWIAGTTQTIKRLYFLAYKTNSPTFNVSASILTGVSNGAPGTVITNGTSGTVAASGFSASPTLGWSYVTFPTAPSVTASSTYFVAICADTADDVNTVVVGKDNDGNGTTDNVSFQTTAIGQNWAVLEDHVGPAIWVTSCDEAKP